MNMRKEFQKQLPEMNCFEIIVNNIFFFNQGYCWAGKGTVYNCVIFIFSYFVHESGYIYLIDAERLLEMKKKIERVNIDIFQMICTVRNIKVYTYSLIFFCLFFVFSYFELLARWLWRKITHKRDILNIFFEMIFIIILLDVLHW